MKFNLDNLVTEYENLDKELSNPEIFKDQKKVRKVATRKKQIEEAVNLYKEYKKLNESLEENKLMLYDDNDEEMRDLLKDEIKELEFKIPEFEEKLKVSLLPKDENDDKNIMVEIRA
jgi:peptide chain release factor 1